MRFGFAILLNKLLLIGAFAGCRDMVLAVGAALQDILTVDLTDIELAIALQFANEPRYWGKKGNLHDVFGNRTRTIRCRTLCYWTAFRL